MKITLTRVEYREILQAYAQAYHHIEQKLLPLEKSLNLGLLPSYRPRLPSILQDLARLMGEMPLEPPPRTVSVPIEAQEAPHYLGLRYVLEGATQGSRLIAERLQKNLPQLPEQAFAFWNIQLEVSKQWPLFCAYLNQVTQRRKEKRQMLKAARSAFCSFIACFSFLEETL